MLGRTPIVCFVCRARSSAGPRERRRRLVLVVHVLQQNDGDIILQRAATQAQPADESFHGVV